MFPPVTAAQLKDVPLFNGLDDQDLETIANRSLFVGARPGIHLASQGESGFEFFVILSGSADVSVEGETIATLGPGDVFGEMALLSEGYRTADVVATSVMSLVTMMVWDFRKTTEEYPVIAERLRELARERTQP
jgi:CRP-like cAMP-binding protein